MSLADRIREHANERYLAPARDANRERVSVRPGDVHSAPELAQRLPAVCSAPGAAAFEKGFAVRLSARTGPHQGATPVFTFSVVGSDPRAPKPEPPARPVGEAAPRLARSTTKVEACFLVSCVSQKRAQDSEERDL